MYNDGLVIIVCLFMYMRILSSRALVLGTDFSFSFTARMDARVYED